MAANSQVFDRYSVVHVAAGALARQSRFSFLATMIASTLFELVLENVAKDAIKTMWPESSHDNAKNILGDTISVAAGYAIAERTETVWPLVVPAIVAAAGWIWSDSLRR